MSLGMSGDNNTNVLFNQCASISRISPSDLFVSSNPGVSTKTTSVSHFSGKQTRVIVISVVQDCKLCPMPLLRPVAILMNYQTVSIVERCHSFALTELFPAPVGPMSLDGLNEHRN